MARLLVALLVLVAAVGCKPRQASTEDASTTAPVEEGETALPDVVEPPAPEDVRLPVRHTVYPGAFDPMREGYINGYGEIVIDPQYDAAYPFHEGVALVKVGDLWGYIDTTGEMILEPQFEEADSFSEGLACVRREGSDPWEYIDMEGNTVISLPANVTGTTFSEGVACLSRTITDDEVVEDESKVTHYALDDILILDPDHYGDAAYRYEYTYIDRTGQVVIESGRFAEVDYFSEGLAAAWDLATGLWGYIDRSGQWQIQPQYETARRFSEGLAAAETRAPEGYEGTLWGYIDKAGQWVMTPQFEWASSFAGGVAAVVPQFEWEHDGQTRYIRHDPLNRVITRENETVFLFTNWSDGERFEQGYMWLEYGHGAGYVSRTGELIWPKGFVLLPNGQVERISDEEPDGE